MAPTAYAHLLMRDQESAKFESILSFSGSLCSYNLLDEEKTGKREAQTGSRSSAPLVTWPVVEGHASTHARGESAQLFGAGALSGGIVTLNK